MAGLWASSTGAKAAVLAGGLVLAALAVYGGWSLMQPATEPFVTLDDGAVTKAGKPSEPATPPGALDDTQVAANQNAATTLPKPDAAAPPVPAANPDPAAASRLAPSFDVVRIDPDGTAVVAGQAAPGSKIILQVDGVEITATTTDASGKFVALFVLDSSDAPRMLTMSSVLPDQTTIVANAEVAISPTQRPSAVAAYDALPDQPPIADEQAPAPVAQAPAALLITESGVTVLQSPAPTGATDTPVPLTIDVISYTPAGDVQLAGRAAADTVLRLYLNNAPLADVTVGKDARWAATMPPIEPGVYTLRADQLAADGSVTARFETPFKRETQAALAAAAQTTPPETDVAVAAGVTLTPDAVPASVPDAATLAESPLAAASDAAAQPVVAAETTPAKPAAPVSITVQPGFTLWGIASQQFGDGVMYVQVFAANKDKIRDPNLIYPGQVFVIPTASK